MRYLVIGFFLIALSLCLSCESFVSLDPPATQTSTQIVFSNESTATSVVVGNYIDMFNKGALTGISVTNGLYADELRLHSQVELVEYYNNALTSQNPSVLGLWSELFSYVYSANSIIEGLEKASGFDLSVKRQLIGEAHFIRALSNFYLVNYWGRVPLVTTIDYRINLNLHKVDVSMVYSSVVQDLVVAEELLYDDYSFFNGDRGRPNVWAAKALLARVYLYLGDWSNAEKYATEIINRADLFNLADDLDDVFLVNSKEAIWQLKSVYDMGVNTTDGETFILSAVPSRFSLSPTFVDDFDEGDQRKVKWVGVYEESGLRYYYPYKYKIKSGVPMPPITEALVIFRLAEQYLIRAESRANLSNFQGAVADLDILRKRAGVDLLVDSGVLDDTADLLKLIYRERKFELFTEFGHRWFDLKRSGESVDILSQIKGTYQKTDDLYPIPLNELNADPKLNPQNDGY